MSRNHHISQHDFTRLALLSNIAVRALNIQNFQSMASLQCLSAIGNYDLLLNLKELDISDSKNGLKDLIIDKKDQDKNCQALKFETLRFHKLELQGIIWKRVTPMELLPKLCALVFSNSDSLKNTAWAMNLAFLEWLEIYPCRGMMKLIGSVDAEEDIEEIAAAETMKTPFPCLRMASLQILEVLRCIADSNTGVAFLSLEHLEVFSCPKLKQLPFQFEFPFKASSSCRLRKTRGTQEWWDALERKDDRFRSSLLPLYEIILKICIPTATQTPWEGYTSGSLPFEFVM